MTQLQHLLSTLHAAFGTTMQDSLPVGCQACTGWELTHRIPLYGFSSSILRSRDYLDATPLALC